LGREAFIEDRELIMRILSGESEIYAELVKAHQAYCYRVCLAIMQDPHQAEEAAQVAFIKAYRHLASFQGRSGFRTWLTRIALNQCKDMLRSLQRHRQRLVSLDGYLESGQALPQSLIHEDSRSEAGLVKIPDKAMQALSQAEKDIIILVREQEGMTYEELSERLGVSLNSIKGRLKRARAKLKKALD
jgi:RNA polymerase sigma-70 factor (ECF subfamily)